jgi:hypothetical protein
MKRSLAILTLNLLLCFSAAAQDKYPVSWDYKGQTFQEFVVKAESSLHVRFFFREEWVSGIRLGDYNGSATLQAVLTNLFRDNSLHFYIDDSGHVVITKDFAVKRPGSVADDPKMFIPTTFYIAGGEDQQKSESVLIEIGNKVDRNRPGNVTVSGYVTNSDTHEKVGGATISIPKIARGAISNEYGFYSLTLPRGTYEVKFSFVGMREKKINLNLFGTGELNVDLQATLIPLKETFISAERSATLQRFEAGAEKINISTFRLTPTSLGEPDLMKNILLISGVQSSGEGSAGFNVRGGSADQNLILLDGAPLYNTSHVFGFFSAINSDIIKDVTLYKGGIPGKFGGRISSVLDIQSLEGSPNKFTGSFGISPITTRLMVSGPIKKDTLYYILAGRTTYSNWIFGKLNNKDIKNSRASFYDLNGTLTWNTGYKDKFEITGYHSEDNSRFNELADYGFVNTTGVAKWQHTYTTRFLSTISANTSYYSYKVADREIAGEEYSREHKLNSSGFQADFNWFRGKHNVNFGLVTTAYSVLPGSWGPASETSVVVGHSIDRESAFESALYAEDKISITPVLSVNAGLRYSAFFATGPEKIYLYDPAVPKSGISVYDTLYISKGSTYGHYSGIEPRLSLNFRLSGTSSLKINYNRTRQYLHLLSNSMSVSPTDTWKLCDYYLKPQIGDQIAAGIYKFMNSRKFEASAEIYYKTIRNMLDYKGGTTLNFIENIEQETINANGKSYGVELSLKQSEGKFQYGVSYTYARTFLRSNGSFSGEIINGGKWYPANCDKPNDLIVTMNFLYSRRLSFSAAYTYSTGRPITLPVGTYRIRDILVIQYSERNKYRIADYKRLDLSVKLSGNLKAKKFGHPNLTFSVYNVMGHYNTYSVYFRKENEIIKGYKLAIFGTQIPTLTFNYDF